MKVLTELNVNCVELGTNIQQEWKNIDQQECKFRKQTVNKLKIFSAD